MHVRIFARESNFTKITYHILKYRHYAENLLNQQSFDQYIKVYKQKTGGLKNKNIAFRTHTETHKLINVWERDWTYIALCKFGSDKMPLFTISISKNLYEFFFTSLEVCPKLCSIFLLLLLCKMISFWFVKQK